MFNSSFEQHHIGPCCSLSSSSSIPLLTGEIQEVPTPLSPLSPPPSADSGAGVRRRHTRVRSITSRAEMMPRPSSAKGRVEILLSRDNSSSPLPTSPTPSQDSRTSRETQVRILTTSCPNVVGHCLMLYKVIANFVLPDSLSRAHKGSYV